MRSILVVNPKGGCGKTTISTNLASYYAVWGVKTALVDFDPQQSCMHWLKARNRTSKNATIYGASGLSGELIVPEDTQRIIYDAPARSVTGKVVELMQQADAVIIPVLPAPIDMRAARVFVDELIRKGRLRKHQRLVGLVANRVRKHTNIYGHLENFLIDAELPFVTSLRDSQNYVRASDRGIGIFEMGPAAVARDLEQWRPLINWIEGKKVKTR
jgi:chromosome partitioning protein